MKKLIVLFQFRGRVGPADGAVIFRWGVSKTDGGGDGRVTCGRLAGLGQFWTPNVNQGIVGKQTARAFGRCIKNVLVPVRSCCTIIILKGTK